MRIKWTALIIIAVAIAGISGYVLFSQKVPPQTQTTPPTTIGVTTTQPQACPQLAKKCSDGSYVGPTGPNCTFVCPISTTSTSTKINTSTITSTSFSASPTSGAAPLTVQFTSSAPQGSDVGNTVNFGDGTSGKLGFVPVCSSCNARGVVSHTYASAGKYTATLTGGTCACPTGGICNCPNIPILGTATVTVNATSGASTIQQLNAPGSASLRQGDIAEVRNESFYFTLQNISTASATIQITPVGCWNSFPSDPPPRVRCMIATVPIPPQTLSVGQTYSVANYSITLTQIDNVTATFLVN
jgi:PKD repeat protein